MESLKFSRKNKFGEQKLFTNYKYDLIIRNAFQYISDQTKTEDEKFQCLKVDYYNVADRNIEKNEFLYERLFKLKLELQEKPKKKIISYYHKVLELFLLAKFLDQKEFEELSALEKKNEVTVKEITYPIKGFPMPPLIDFENVFIHKNKAVSEAIINYIREEAETEETLELKKRALEFIDEIYQKIDFTKISQDCKVDFELYGSFVNQFSIKGSDIDVSLNIDNDQIDEKIFINGFFQALKNKFQNSDIEIERITKSRVPIVEITFKKMANVTVSFSINNILGVINSEMLKTYSQLDKKCQMLGILVKLWAKAQDVISAKKNFLSSYAYNLMVINFLQTLKNPLLPSLQKIREEDESIQPQYFSIRSHQNKQNQDERKTTKVRVDFENDISKIKSWMEKKNNQKNGQSVISLLRGFFKFYMKKKNFEGVRLSVKVGNRIKRDESQDPKENSYLYSIEDPFDPFHNPGKYILEKTDHAHQLLGVMERSYNLLKEGNVTQIFQKNI